MYLLAFETAFGKFSIALFRDSTVLDKFSLDEEHQQAEMLIPSIEKILSKNKISYNDLDYIAVGIGPGSFTGVRIGMAAAKGIALGCHAKLIGVSSLNAAAHAQNGGKVYIDASRGDAFFQEFDKNLKPLNEPEMIKYSGKFSELPNAVSIGEVALKNLQNANQNIEPLYIRKPDAKFRLRNGTIDDAPALAEIHARCFPTPLTTLQIAGYMQIGAEVIMAEGLGFIIFQTISDECEIKTIAVSPHAQRKSVAHFICQHMLKKLAEKNVRKVFLEVEETNQPAIKLYEKLGFTVFNKRNDYYGAGRHAMLMQLAISA